MLAPGHETAVSASGGCMGATPTFYPMISELTTSGWALTALLQPILAAQDQIQVKR